MTVMLIFIPQKRRRTLAGGDFLPFSNAISHRLLRGPAARPGLNGPGWDVLVLLEGRCVMRRADVHTDFKINSGTKGNAGFSINVSSCNQSPTGKVWKSNNAKALVPISSWINIGRILAPLSLSISCFHSQQARRSFSSSGCCSTVKHHRQPPAPGTK